ncbi:translation initiation factor IF-2 [Candidatus Woesearchaeota archaeon CG_4_10_14_0_2_um_filter_33_10]|nr:MAG: translation initiation factor IF-2 [Candidatus Woesearchaeota archaeon CG1_02_33_12]PIN79249.1 MAG: translation initiation factor IF-2 [Candidatus Woesearchaeota archaeon CG10_big_fil_rev_8_21_14_0_10_33_12]PIU72484.1 MAG: translation initiation factor IF-2 [Candidatus Woesearchaeota archaeon CG06_land_8_20_14_3_00_33_13]PIZ52899.1 MAG: translation initiation factor IF-2 [Candidatus Woesearchaeota archaeon CG_4_10_14_0_2_um_filter_33_10]
MNTIRSPVCTVVGHVDHGKSSLLDYIRHSHIVKDEAGAITQAIGASLIPLDTIKKVCGPLLDSLKIKFTIPGLLFIDTPGHAAFTNLRKRGGSLADIAILVVDINEGFKPQTEEAVEILKHKKTPFIVVANKIDLLPGWNSTKDNILKSISNQGQDVQKRLDIKLYEILGKLHEFGFASERFDRVLDYTKEIAIIPVSSKTGEGIPELLMVLTGLAQKYLEGRLECDINRPAKGTVLEVKEGKGLGVAIDVIIYDGTLKKDDVIVIGGIKKPVVTKVRALFEPMPLSEIRDKKARFKQVSSVCAARCLRISAPEIENVVAGMPLMSSSKDSLEKTKQEIQKLVSEVIIETDIQGIILKADSLGSLEALINIFREKNINIRRASIGNISKKDVIDADSNYEKDPLKAVVIGFNVSLNDDAKSEKVKIFTSDIIYKLIEDFEKWVVGETKRREAAEVEMLIRPCKIKIMPGYVFRQNNPAVVGVDILEGKIKTNMRLMKDVIHLTTIKSIQSEKKKVTEAEKGKQVAISLDKVTVGRQINEGDILYSVIPESDFKKLKELKKHLTEGEITLLKEIAVMMRKENSLWGV